MAIEYGITESGFVKKTLSVLLNEIGDALKDAFGEEINLADESVFGQLRGISAEREKLLWELAEDVYNSYNPDAAYGASLDNVCSLTGTERLAAQYSTIANQKLFGTATTVIPAGTQFSVLNDENTTFATDEEVTLIAGTDEVQTITFSGVPATGAFTLFFEDEETASIPYTAVAADIQTALNDLDLLSAVTVSGSFAAGFVVTFAGVDGKQEQDLLVEGTNTLAVTITITETTPGVNQGTVDMTCTELGPTVVNDRTLTVIDNPITGLTSTSNPENAATGRDIETDAELRIRRNLRLTTSQAGPIEAIKTHVLDLNDDEDEPELTVVKVFENVTDFTDAKGLPPHSVCVIVRQAGDVTTRDAEIAQAIFESKCAGIQTSWGNCTGLNQVTESVTDTMGVSRNIYFGRPEAVDIYCDISSLVTDSDYPTDGDDQIKAALVAWGNALGVGQDVIVYPQLVAQLADIPGILDFDIDIGTAPGPSGDSNITIDDGSVSVPEYSNWETANISVS